MSNDERPDSLVVLDWDKIYETSESRKIKNLGWVAVPNKMDSGGYLSLVEQPNAAAHFGAWLAILEIASRQPKRGTIICSHNSGRISRHLGRISRLPESVFSEAIPVLEVLKWVKLTTYENHRENLPEHQDVPLINREIFSATITNTDSTSTKTSQLPLPEAKQASRPLSKTQQASNGDLTYEQFVRLDQEKRNGRRIAALPAPASQVSLPAAAAAAASLLDAVSPEDLPKVKAELAAAAGRINGASNPAGYAAKIIRDTGRVRKKPAAKKQDRVEEILSRI